MSSEFKRANLSKVLFRLAPLVFLFASVFVFLLFVRFLWFVSFL